MIDCKINWQSGPGSPLLKDKACKLPNKRTKTWKLQLPHRILAWMSNIMISIIYENKIEKPKIGRKQFKSRKNEIETWLFPVTLCLLSSHQGMKVVGIDSWCSCSGWLQETKDSLPISLHIVLMLWKLLEDQLCMRDKMIKSSNLQLFLDEMI